MHSFHLRVKAPFRLSETQKDETRSHGGSQPSPKRAVIDIGERASRTRERKMIKRKREMTRFVFEKRD